MMTRRMAVGAGLALASAACAAGLAARGPAARHERETRSFDALLIDEGVEISTRTAALIRTTGRTTPVFAIRLDAAGQGPLARTLSESRAIVGVSSGATLFCLERIAWDHGFRLTARRQQCAGDTGDDACRQELISLLGEFDSPASISSPLDRAYRPSRADGMLHAWAMRKALPTLRRHRQEVQA